MNLYLISQEKNPGYDTYDSAVVAAPDEETARAMEPREKAWSAGSWAAPVDVKVQFIGVAKNGTEQGVVCASFNAG